MRRQRACWRRAYHAAAHLRPLGIGLGRLFGLAGVAVGLREVEPVAVIVRFLLQALEQEPYVALELADPIEAARMVLVSDAVKLLAAAAGHAQIFMGAPW